jgi:hypothetical protein
MPTLLKVSSDANCIVHIKAFIPSFICGVRLNSEVEVHLGRFEDRYCIFFNTHKPILIKRYIFPTGFPFGKAREIFAEYASQLAEKPYLIGYALQGTGLVRAQQKYEASKI